MQCLCFAAKKTKLPACLAIFHAQTCASSHSTLGMCYPSQPMEAHSCFHGWPGSPKPEQFISLESSSVVAVSDEQDRQPWAAFEQLMSWGHGLTLWSHWCHSCFWLLLRQEGHLTYRAKKASFNWESVVLWSKHRAWQQELSPPTTFSFYQTLMRQNGGRRQRRDSTRNKTGPSQWSHEFKLVCV